MAGIKIMLQWSGSSNTTRVANQLAVAARKGSCSGRYDSKVWAKLNAVLQAGPLRVLYNSE